MLEQALYLDASCQWATILTLWYSLYQTNPWVASDISCWKLNGTSLSENSTEFSLSRAVWRTCHQYSKGCPGFSSYFGHGVLSHQKIKVTSTSVRCQTISSGCLLYVDGLLLLTLLRPDLKRDLLKICFVCRSVFIIMMQRALVFIWQSLSLILKV